MSAGDEIQLTDGKGAFYLGQIISIDSKKCAFKIKTHKTIPKKNYRIHIAIAPTKNADRIEWFVEKAVELGVDQITFMQCQRSERRVINLERMNKVAISALKQSRQAWMPALDGLKDFKNVVDEPTAEKFIAYVDGTNPLHLKHAFKKNNHYLVIVGPEGDFTTDELDMALSAGFKKVSLGPNRLRTETAALAAIHILSLQ